MSVYLLFYWFLAAPNDKLQTMMLMGVFDSRAGCERAEELYRNNHVVEHAADMTCVQRYIEK